MTEAVKIVSNRNLLKIENDFKKIARKFNNINMHFICYLDIYYDGEFKFLKTNKKVKDFDIFLIGGKQGLSMKQGLIYYFGHIKKKHFVDRFTLNKLDNTKFIQLIFMNEFSINHPDSIFFVIDNFYSDKYVNILEAKFSYPFIAKDVCKDKGTGVFLIKNRDDLKNLFNNNQYRGFIFQEYIENDGDIRVLVMGKKVVSSYKRYNNTDFRNNVSTGGKTKKYRITKKLENLAVKIANKYGIGLCGLDFFVKKDNYILIEINDLPEHRGLKSYKNTDFASDMLEYFSTLLK